MEALLPLWFVSSLGIKYHPGPNLEVQPHQSWHSTGSLGDSFDMEFPTSPQVAQATGERRSITNVETPSPAKAQHKRPYKAPQLSQQTPAGLLEHLQNRATAGDPAAQFMLGYALEMGMCGPADLQAAVYWYRKAALQAVKPKTK
jgi:TPR repeat protein